MESRDERLEFSQDNEEWQAPAAGARRRGGVRGRSRRVVTGRIELRAGEVASLWPRRRGLAVGCVAGRLWLTASGDAQDHLLVSSERIVVAARRHVVLEALGEATVTIEPGEWGRLRQALGARRAGIRARA